MKIKKHTMGELIQRLINLNKQCDENTGVYKRNEILDKIEELQKEIDELFS